MNDNPRFRGAHLVLMLTAAFIQQASHAEDSEKPFNYSDEWSLVSAPPPAGPYQPVNIDPRVPGPGTIPQVPMAIPRQQATQELPAAVDMEEAGASAGAAEQTAHEVVITATSDEPPAMPPVPGHYRPVMTHLTGEPAGESITGGESATAQQEQAAEPVMTMEAAVPAVPATTAAGGTEPVVEEAAQVAEPSIAAEALPATAGAGMEMPAAGTAAAMVPEATADSSAAPAAQEQEQVAQPSIAAEAEPALPATAGAGVEMPVAGTAAAMVPEATADSSAAPAAQEQEQVAQPSIAVEAEPALAVGEEPQMPGRVEPAPATPPAGLAAEPAMMQAPPVAAGTAAGQQRQAQEEVPVPSIAGGMPGMPVAGQASAAPQEQPYFQPPMPGYYDRMMPPAAGRIAPEPPVTSPPGPAERLQGQPGERAPAGGYYGRPMPAAPGYNYPAPGYPYQSGRPGYWNMPGYGYPRGQAMPEEQNVPPPPVYDTMQYPRTPGQGYR